MTDPKQTLERYKQQLAERGMTQEATKVTEQIHEMKTAERIRQFYCRHVFQRVAGTFFGFETKAKICQRCGFIR